MLSRPNEALLGWAGIDLGENARALSLKPIQGGTTGYRPVIAHPTEGLHNIYLRYEPKRSVPVLLLSLSPPITLIRAPALATQTVPSMAIVYNPRSNKVY